MSPKDVKMMIEKGLPDALVEVQGEDHTHFEAVVVTDAFEGKSLLQQHRMVYATLGDNMQANIHALTMRTFTKAQWQAQRG